jgi:exodeoxyribonuclease VII small subunit
MQSNPITPPSEQTFENAFARLELILERMNSGTISLDEALKLYEEADSLIMMCNKRLNDAERKIEILIKNRGGDLALGADQKPQVQNFSIPSNQGQKPTPRDIF